MIEVAALFIGAVDLVYYSALRDIMPENWSVQLEGSEKHSFISLDAAPTIVVLLLLVLAAYLILRFVPVDMLPPMVAVLCMSALYLGIALCVVFCIQTAPDFFFILLPANCILLFIKTIFLFICQKNVLWSKQAPPDKFPKLAAILNKTSKLPLIALLLALPLLGVIVIVLLLFGQEPSSIIKAWTDTADWNLSQQIPPENLPYDGHYLCTVAAGGHRKIVKPLRTGLRHGHRVVVNRQLCIANAFEQVLSEKTPRFHKCVRSFYDRAGYPIAKHIRTKWVADVVYFIMKPLEWFFLLVLYTVDAKPEDRIAVQYPHAALPTTEP